LQSKRSSLDGLVVLPSAELYGITARPAPRRLTKVLRGESLSGRKAESDQRSDKTDEWTGKAPEYQKLDPLGSRVTVGQGVWEGVSGLTRPEV